MTNLRDAIDVYHSLLDDEIGRASQEQLDDQQKRRGLFFGQRPLCTVLRPRLLTTGHYYFLQRAMRAILPAFAQAYRAALSDPALRAQFMLTGWEEELIRHDPGFRDPSPTSRMDCFFLPDEGQLYLTEYNAEVPAAAGYTSVLSEAFEGLPIMREFEKRFEVRPLPARHHTLHALLDAHRQWAGRETPSRPVRRPHIAILDWREVPTYSEFVIFRDYIQSQGFECVIADPREVEYRDGKLTAQGFQIDLIYKRVLLSELVERGGIDHPVIRAVSDGAACIVNAFHCKVLHKKASLAVLSDETNRHLFGENERRAIEAYVPWTRAVKERHTEHHGQRVDLVPFLADHKDEFVLKPNDEYGGKGIVLGWNATQGEWEAALRAGLAEPYIVQQRVKIPTEPYPSLVDGRVEIVDRMLDMNPYIWYGDYMSGCLTRLSTAALLNVTAGGGSTVPTFVIEKRE
jgi:hypothetical protein